ncbi:hypothetical protein ACFE04_002062 [Oxalis oulophora]
MAVTYLSEPIIIAVAVFGFTSSQRHRHIYNMYDNVDRKLTITTTSQRLPLRCYAKPRKTPYDNSTWKSTDNLRDYDDDKTNNSESITGKITDILRIMDSLRIPVSPDIYTSLIKECTIAKDSRSAMELHNHIKNSSLKVSLPLLNRLLLMHASCGRVRFARPLFDQMPLKDFNSWAAMIVGYTEVDDYDEAIDLFVKMHLTNRETYYALEFPAWIMVCILKACIMTMNLDLGKQIHGSLIKFGKIEDPYIVGTLMDLYGKFGCSEDVNIFFDRLESPDTITWTTRIVNKCKQGCYNEVIDDFNEMGRQGIKRNCFTFSSVLKACSGINDNGNCGKQVHANAIKLGFESETFVQCGLIDMYGRYGLLRDAERLFVTINDKKNVAYWTALLKGYLRNGYSVEAIKLLYMMRSAGIKIRESLINEVKTACGAEIDEKFIQRNGMSESS